MAGTNTTNGNQHTPMPTPATVPSSTEDASKWGTHLMGAPANPATHPDNQKAALWKASDQQRLYYHDQPYLVYSPLEKPTNNPLEPVINVFNSWSKKTETIARNIWHNLKMGPSVSEAAWGKINLTAKALSEGGFESLFKQIFDAEPNEKLKKTFACYLSTATGPVAGTLYLSTHRIGFCSDRPLSFIAPSGQEAWSYYKVMMPLARVSTVNPVTMGENPTESYIQIVTVDNHEFWFMGFVNFEKATQHLLDAVSAARAAELAAQPPAPYFNTMTGTPEENERLGSIKEPESSKRRGEDAKNGGNHVHFIDPPANPSGVADDQSVKATKLYQQKPYDYQDHDHLYLLYSPVNKSRSNPFKPVCNMFTTWTRKATDVSQNVWHNLKTGPSVSGGCMWKDQCDGKGSSKGRI
ncbi:hypothetical protein Ancab_020429 [Ancistrocladus abbreviatus]